ncbi:MAG: septation protein A [Rhodospirillales bacterium]|nr:septation protein A [Rhodospirillales bacterium]
MRNGIAPARPALSPLLKLVLEAGPLVVFFVMNARSGIFEATAAFMAAVAVALAATYILARQIPILPLVSGVFVLAFGALTLALNDDLFIKLKPTVVNLLFGAILFAGLAFGRPLLQPLLDSMLRLTGPGWRRLTAMWAGFFCVLAVLNEVVWRSFSTDFWVSFKLFGIMPLTLVFSALAIYLVRKEMIPEDGERPEEKPSEEKRDLPADQGAEP